MTEIAYRFLYRNSCDFLLSVAACFVLVSCVATDTQKPAPVSHYGRQQGAGSAGIHTVVEGDTLWSVAQRYNMAMRDIAVKNRLSAPFKLKGGQRLWLPPPMEYRVRSGDTLYEVSRVFGVNTSEIAQLNDLRAPYRLQPGSTLRMPSVTRKVAQPYDFNDDPSIPDYAGMSPEVVMPPTAPAPVEREILAPPPEEQMQTAALPPPVEEKINPQPLPKISKQTPKRSSGKFLRPVEGKVISQYGPKNNGLHNDGINIKAPKGTPVLAAENGVVVYAGSELKGSGNLVLVRHEGNWMSAYAHMDQTTIKRGDTVTRGQSIGTVGSTGSVSEPQLHFELRRGTEAINPDRYLEG